MSFEFPAAGKPARDGIDWLADLCRDLQVPPLSELGITESDFSLIVEKSKNASSMKSNLVSLSGEQLMRILQGTL